MSEHVAVVGMAARVPRAQSVDEMWDRLVDGRDCIEHFAANPDPPNELDELLMQHGTSVYAGGVLDDIAAFDPGFFGFSRLDGELLDPQHRVFLEVARHALDDAAAPPGRSIATAVFAGCAMSSYLQHNLLANPDVVARVGAYPLVLGNDKDFLATRVSYKLGLGGPSMSVQTACSTSLVAVHMAVQSLLARECDAALAGGVSIRVPQRRGYLHQPGGVLSVDGRCRPFDSRATGFVPGNGAAVLVLRRLDDAIAEGDAIRAVVRASAVNNDGADRLSFTAPGLDGQVRVLSEALGLSGLLPHEVTLVEAHGTATALGDAVEFAALERVYGRADTTCLIGSAKANFGHLDAAAGAVGLIKAVLSLEREMVPPLVHFETPNPKLEIERSRFRIPAAPVSWPRGDCARRVAVTSLGLGGTNAHVVLEEAPARERRRPAPDRARVIPVSAQDQGALAVRASDVTAAIRGTDDEHVADLAFSLATRPDAFAQRLALVVGDGDRTPRRRAIRSAAAPRVAFAFPGGGAQHVAMAAPLARREPAFAAELDHAISLVEPLVDADLRAAVLGQGDGAAMTLRRPGIGLPALFCVQFATARLLRGWGIEPDAVIGHSAGEYAAACVAGVLSEIDAARLVVTRSAGFDALPASAMLSVSLDEAAMRSYLSARDGLEVSAINTPAHTVIGGLLEAIEAIQRELEASGVPCRRVHVDVAAHTSLVAGVAEQLVDVARTMPMAPPVIGWVSNISGTWLAADDVRAEYWGEHLCRTVRFWEGLRTLSEAPGRIVLDIGPGETIRPLFDHVGETGDAQVVSVAAGPHADASADVMLAAAVGELWSAGVGVDWAAMYARERRRRVRLPPYPFQRVRCWIEPGPGRRAQPGARTDGCLYVPVLVPAPERGPQGLDGTWLVLGDGSALAAAVTGALLQRGVDVVTVEAGEVHEQVGPRAYRLPLADDDAIAALLEAIGRGCVLAGALAVWDREPGDATLPYHATVAFAKAAGRAPASAPRRFVVVTRCAERVPELALASAAAAVIERETPDLTCSTIDLDPHDDDELAADRLVRELAAEPAPALIVRDGVAQVERFRRVAPPARPVQLRPGGVWIVSGGLGAIGRTLAVHLARTANARLVLVGRRPVPAQASWPSLGGEDAERIAALREIAATGGAYVVVTGDVAERTVAEEAVRIARERFGGVHGLIHAAGVPAGGLAQLRDPGQSEAVLRPKVRGARELGRALGDTELDVVVLCSALDTVLATPGQAEHCAANAFLDATASGTLFRARRTVSIAWSAWRDIGQAARAEVPAALREWRELTMASAITAAEGCQLFDHALALADVPKVVTSVSDVEELREFARGASVRDVAAATLQHPDRTAGQADLRSPVEERVSELWTALLNVQAISRDEDFFALGGHSLAAMQLASLLRETFDVPVPLEGLLARATVAEQAELVETLVMEQIEQLSNDEVLRRLEETR